MHKDLNSKLNLVVGAGFLGAVVARLIVDNSKAKNILNWIFNKKFLCVGKRIKYAGLC